MINRKIVVRTKYQLSKNNPDGKYKKNKIENIDKYTDKMLDYYSNIDNDGNIGISLYNYSDKIVEIKKGERICQGIFVPFLEADNGNTDNERQGGFGSSGK